MPPPAAETSCNNTTLSIKQPLKLPTKEGIFSGKKFQILGFDESETEALEDLSLERGACIVPFDLNMSLFHASTRENIDFTLMPMTIPKRISNSSPATVFWMVVLVYLLV